MKQFEASSVTPEHLQTRTRSQAIAVSRLSRDVAARFRDAPSAAGSVHSVFERAVNLRWHDGHLVTLQEPGALSAPFAAVVDHLPRRLLPDMAVRRRAGVLEIDGVQIDWRRGAMVDTAMPESVRGSTPALVAMLTSADRRYSRGLDSAQGRRARALLASALSRRDAAGFGEGALGLIGLGEGLTPAGDDCLVGALAVIQRFSRAWLLDNPQLSAAVGQAAETGTTEIAREFIAHALNGHFSECLIELLTADSPQDARDAAARLLAMGATSGADTLVGIRLALEAL